MLKRFDESLASLNEALRLSPDYVEAIFEIGQLYLDMRNQARAGGKTAAANGYELKAKEEATKLQKLDPEKAQQLSDLIKPPK